MKTSRALATVVAGLGLVGILSVVPVANAAEGGYGNYVPGTYSDFGMAGAPAGALTLRNDLYVYHADTARAVRSGRVEAEVRLVFLASFTSLYYKPGVELLGGQYVAGVFIPLMNVDYQSSVSGSTGALKSDEDASGIGDIAWIPIALFWNRDKLHYSFSHSIVSPTGDYDVADPINVGLNYWSFDTSFAITHLDLETGRDCSVSIGHMYNTKNDDTDYQSGQNVHVDVAVNQFLSETVAVGVQGFYLNQVTGDSGSGALLGDFQAEAAGIGPAVLCAKRIGEQDMTFIAKWLHEYDVENRIRGDHVYVSLVMDW